jgi:aryl-alcohol dehydrogenase-like predicted oxidoreductase
MRLRLGTLTVTRRSGFFAALSRLQEQGKVRHIGVSNFARPTLEEALACCPDLAVNELPHNLLSRAIEWEALPASRELGLGVIGYLALLQGVLTDLYPTLDDIPMWQRRTRHFDAKSGIRNRGSGIGDWGSGMKSAAARHALCGEEQATRQTLAALRAVCRENGRTLSELALKWAVANRDVACSLVGSRSPSKLEANVRAVEHPLSAEMVRRLNAITDPLKERLGRSFDYYEGPDNDRTR